jgi:hypothetical protein
MKSIFLKTSKPSLPVSRTSTINDDADQERIAITRLHLRSLKKGETRRPRC